MRIPDEPIRYVLGAAAGEARVSANRIGGTAADPALLILCNGLATKALLDAILAGVGSAPDPETKEIWRSLGLQLASAIQGAIVS